MENNDIEAIKLWSWFKEISIISYEKIYKRLNISFDSYNGESFYNDKMMPIVHELEQKGLLIDSDGAKIVDLEKYKMPPCLILRRDGGTLYPTRDIASAIYRKKEYNFVKVLYITGQEQSLHFSQWFKVVELMGYDWFKNLIHIPFGLINFADGKISTRRGNVLLMDDLIDEAVYKIKNIINIKNPNLKDKDKISEQIGIGAVKFNDLYNGRIKDIEFSWDRMLNFEGETGPYVQYTYARCISVLKKSDIDYSNPNFEILINDDEFTLIKILYQFPEKIVEASEKFEPYSISRYVMLLVQSFNRFYHNNSILKSDKEIKIARLALTECTKNTIYNSLRLLGIEAPEEM
jgi:arginyl-tRNA synthetase